MVASALAAPVARAAAPFSCAAYTAATRTLADVRGMASAAAVAAEPAEHMAEAELAAKEDIYVAPSKVRAPPSSLL